MIDPINRIGSNDLYSGNFNWSLPLAGLPGRAGLSAGMALSYNSLVWNKYNGNSIGYDMEGGVPGRGFNIDLPRLSSGFTSSVTLRNTYVLFMPSGARLELRYVGSTAGSSIYEAEDSSHVRVVFTSVTIGGVTSYIAILYAPDGTQYKLIAGSFGYLCYEIKDRNGNVMMASYRAGSRQLATLTDTLGRTLSFNYNTTTGRLESISQSRSGGILYTWARFYYGSLTINTNYVGVTNNRNGEIVTVLTSVTLADDSRYDFTYNPYGQVNKISRLTQTDPTLPATRPTRDWRVRSYTSYNYGTDVAQTDCPRVKEMRSWAQSWNGDVDGVASVAEETLTRFEAGANRSWVTVTLPDGTAHKETFYTDGWRRGLPQRTETFANGNTSTPVKTTETFWTQDDEGLAYPRNPRVTEATISDGTSTRRTRIEYRTYLESGTNRALWTLPTDVYEYAANVSQVLRRTHTEYYADPVANAVYTNRRIIGLVKEQTLYDGSGKLYSKVDYLYDEPIADRMTNAGTVTGHDYANYSATLTVGRGNVTSVRRWDADSPTDAGKASVTTIGYNTTGAVVWSKNPLGRQTTITYAEDYKDSNNARGTLAYPTRVSDPDGFTSKVQYDFYTGAVVRSEDPKGAAQALDYDAAGRLTKSTNLVNSAYTEYVYPASQKWLKTFTTVNSLDANLRAYSLQVFDGAGRRRAASASHPGSTGGFSGQQTTFDNMGRAVAQTVPVEIDENWTPRGDDAAMATNGWLATRQTYDWKGRPLVTTTTDNKTRSISYEGCGCAGGEVVTTTDEVGRRQKIYSDILGRTVKQEDLNTDGSVYRTMTNIYNVRDQVMQAVQQAGTNGAAQTTTVTYDGHGRRRTVRPPSATGDAVYDYYADDAVQKVTDARGAAATYAYNARGMVTAIDYTVASGVAATANVRMDYDRTGNRVWMTDGEGRVDYVYDALSRLVEETRQFNGVGRSHRLGYEYNIAGALRSLTDSFGAKVNYNLDSAGRLDSVTGENFAGVGSYASNMKYRAWGALKGISYGNGLTAAATYNTRQQVASFAVTGRNAQVGTPTVMNAEYKYYADGGVWYMDDLVDDRFNRAFAYDTVGRMSQALSGGAAQNFYTGTTTSGVESPYSQTLQHDEWGNMVGGGSVFWGRPKSNAATYNATTGRNAAWVYDGAGNVTRDANRVYEWDAAGRNSRTVSTRNASDTIVQGFSGDGARVRKVETVPQTVTTYYVTSSVLGGRVVTELNAQGEKKTTYVYGAGEVIAKQEVAGTASSVRFVHQDPVIGSRQETSLTGATLLHAEMDANGVNVGVEDPDAGGFGGGSIAPEIPTLLAYDAFGNEGGSGFCTLDGIGFDCGMASRMLSSGAAIPSALAAFQNRPGFLFQSVGLGLYRYYVPNAATLDDQVEGNNPSADPDGTVNVTTDVPQGTWGFLAIGFGSSFCGQQRTQTPQARQQRDNRTDCERFADIVAQLAAEWIRAANEWVYDASGFRDALYNRFNNNPGRNTEFGSTGFRPEFRDNTPPDNSPNQVYHYVGAFRAGFAYGSDGGGAIMENHENDYIMLPRIPGVMPSIPIGRLPDTPSHRADKALNQVGVRHGANVYGGHIRPNQLADAIRRDVCAH